MTFSPRFARFFAVLILFLNLAVARAAVTFETVRAFSRDGRAPNTRLVRAGDGNYYGMTLYGGRNETGFVAGTVFPSHSGGRGRSFVGLRRPQILRRRVDGCERWKTSTELSRRAGTSGRGEIFRLTTGGTYTRLYSFKGQTADGYDGQYPGSAPVEASDGALYGVAGGIIYRVNKAGSVSTAFRFETSEINGPDGSLVIGPDGAFLRHGFLRRVGRIRSHFPPHHLGRTFFVVQF